jgi:hypothetical protein
MTKEPEDIEDIGYCMRIYKPGPDSECADCFAAEDGDCPGMINVLAKKALRRESW